MTKVNGRLPLGYGNDLAQFLDFATQQPQATISGTFSDVALRRLFGGDPRKVKICTDARWLFRWVVWRECYVLTAVTIDEVVYRADGVDFALSTKEATQRERAAWWMRVLWHVAGWLPQRREETTDGRQDQHPVD